MTLAWVYPASMIVKSIVHEKELRLALTYSFAKSKHVKRDFNKAYDRFLNLFFKLLHS